MGINITVNTDGLSQAQKDYILKKMNEAGITIINGLQFIEWINEFNESKKIIGVCDNDKCPDRSEFELVTDIDEDSIRTTNFVCKKCRTVMFTLYNHYKLERIEDDE
jgi:hypothetical protein